jgi:hypothetical protein
MKNLISLVLCILAVCGSALAQKDKLSVEELLTKHAASIGTPEARAAAKSLVLVGEGTLSSKLGYSGRTSGPAQFASADDKLLLAIIFNSSNYRYEKLAFDGKELSFGRPFGGGDLSRLGEFVRSQSSIVKHGLFGGVLSSNWVLTQREKTKVRMEYAGMESFGGKPLHKLKLRPPGGGDLRVSAYFDVDTFRHLVTTYEYSIAAYSTSTDRTENALAKASHFSLTEQFSDFKKVGDLILPLGYSINVASDMETQTENLIWTMSFKQAYFNEPLEVSAFKVS